MQCHLVARHYICELCNVILLQGIMYVNYAMPCCLGKHHICELYHVVLFCILVHQPFEFVMEKSGVKTRSSEQTMLPAEADILLVTDSSLEEDSEADDQSYPPRGTCSNLAGLYCSYHAYGGLHCHAICLD